MVAKWLHTASSPLLSTPQIPSLMGLAKSCGWFWLAHLDLSRLLERQQGDQTRIKGNQSWIIGRTDTEAEAPILWPPDVKSWLTGKRPQCWERLRAEGDDRGWDGWMASLTQRTWVWASSERQWRREKPGILQSTGLQSRTWLSDWTTT